MTKMRRWFTPAPLLLAALGAGCRTPCLCVLASVGVVTAAGYTVYKGGEKAVTSVVSVAGSTTSSAAKGAKRVGAVIFVGGEFKSTCSADVAEVWRAASQALRQSGFRQIKGDSDALSGRLSATTWEGKDVTVKLRALDAGQTELRIRVGVRGDLAASEIIYDRTVAELRGMHRTGNAARLEEDPP